MSGFVDILSQIMQIGGPAAKPVVDETGLTGHYEVSLTLSLADLMAAARAQGTDVGCLAAQAAGRWRLPIPEARDRPSMRRSRRWG